MRRKGIWITLGAILVLSVGMLGFVAVLLRHEPAFYTVLGLDESPARKKNSVEFQTHFFDLMNSINNNDSTWTAEFTAEQINSYFQEDFVRSNAFESMLPEGVHSPRIGISANRVRLAFRYGTPIGSSVISVDMKCWLVAKESNLVALEMVAFRAGHLPLPIQTLLDYITEAAHQMNIDVRWYRHDGHPVALMRFQADQLRPTVQLQRLHIQDGKMLISGRSLIDTIPPLSARRPDKLATPVTPITPTK